MGWNYRVIHKVNKGAVPEDCYEIHEVYYKANNDDNPQNVTVRAVTPYGETLEELADVFKMYTRALTKPVLEMSDFQCGGKYGRE